LPRRGSTEITARNKGRSKKLLGPELVKEFTNFHWV